MHTDRIALTYQPGDLAQVWAKHDGSHLTIALGCVQIDRIPVEDVDTLHGALAAALGKPCRPRTYEEMLAGHTREGLSLLDEPTPAVPSTEQHTI